MRSLSGTEDYIEIDAGVGAGQHTRSLIIPRLGGGERKLILYVIDFLLLVSALIISVTTQTDLLPNLSAIAGYGKWFVTLALVWLPVSCIFDLYSPARAASTLYGVLAAASASSLTSFIYLAIPWFTPPLENRTQVFLFVLLTTSTVSIWRLVYARVFEHPAFRRRALIVGTGKSGKALAEALQSEWVLTEASPSRGTGYTLLGFVEDESAGQKRTVAGLPVLGDSHGLLRLVRTLAVDEVVIALPDMERMNNELFEVILDCRELGIPVVNMVTFYERLTGRVAVEYACNDVALASGREDSPFNRFYTVSKRFTDLSLALVALCCMLPLMLVIAVANTRTSPGPLFFRQQRVGRGGRPFKIIKFRTMVPDAERRKGAVWAGKNDARVTPIGRWLRKTHLDELPQVLNVLQGEMSLVGPRPERPEFVGELSECIPFYRARHAVRPGITGWAQIHQDYGDSVELALEKLEYDLFYVKHTSFFLDILIMLRTVAMVLGLRGR